MVSPGAEDRRPPDNRSKVTDSRATLATAAGQLVHRDTEPDPAGAAATAAMTTVGSATGQRWSRYSR